MRTVLVTGTSSGIGEATVRFLAERGFLVYANVLEEGMAAVWEGTPHVRPTVFDVRRDDEIGRAARRIREEVGELFAVVNNAGISNWGPILDIPDAVWADNLETNLMGAVKVTRAFFPILSREASRVVNVSSAAGRLMLPFMGPYSMAKAALEAFSDTLRRELRLGGFQGTKVVVVEPGSVGTPLWDRAERTIVFPQSSPFYEVAHAIGRGMIREERGKAYPPIAIARVIHKALTTRNPRTRYLVGPQSWAMWILLHLPDKWVDRITFRLADRLRRRS